MKETKDFTVENNKESKLITESNLNKFSKRYSLTGREELAKEIKELRFKHEKKKENHPDLHKTVNEKKIELEKLEKEHEILVNEIETLKNEVEKEKSKLWSKIKSHFKKIELEKELQIEVKNKKVEDLKKEIEERLKIISETENVISDTSLLTEAEEKVNSFYIDQSGLKSSLENEKEKRSVESLSKKHDCIFIHGIPWQEKVGAGNTSENNAFIKADNITVEDRIKLIMGLQPTISVSVLKEGTRKESLYPFGLILSGGSVLSAHNDDAGTVAKNLYYRKSKYDHDEKTKGTSIQPNIEENIEKSLKQKSPQEMRHYNEFVVEEPKIAAFYVNMSNFDMLNKYNIFEELKKYTNEFNLPVFALKDGKMYPMGTESTANFEEFITDDGITRNLVSNQKRDITVGENSISLEKIIEKNKNLENEEKLALVSSIIENKPFHTEATLDYDSFWSFSNGGGTFSSQYTGCSGYKRILDYKKTNKEYINEGRMGDIDSPEISLMKQKDRLIECKNFISTTQEYKRKLYYKDVLRKELMAMYGFSLGALEHGDIKINKLAEDIINEFGSVEECKKFIERRVDEQGKFKVLDNDIPIDIRNKIAELSGKVKE